MKSLKKFILVFTFVFCFAAPATFAADEKTAPAPAEKSAPAADESGWMTDYKKAAAAAKKDKKMLLLDFTGSDWCGWCIKLDKEVFETDEFKKYAKEKLILVKLDFPKKTEIPEETKKQNKKLAAKYDITGYPTVVILDSREKTLGTLGYIEGGPKAFTAAVDELKSGKGKSKAGKPAKK